MRNKRIIAAVVVVAAVVLSAGHYFFGSRGNSDALWQIISQQCIPDQQQHGSPKPCLAVNPQQGYVLFKDRRGPHHDLLLPTEKITGIESPRLLEPDAPALFDAAWRSRRQLADEWGKPIADDNLALAINSYYGRTQNQLHIHISCLRPDVYTILREQAATITTDWQPLRRDLLGNAYLARKLATGDLTREEPFKLLNQYAQSQGDSMADYALALTATADGQKILLATRHSLFRQNKGSSEELLDVSCAVAQ